MQVSFLEWDSNFFNRAVAKIDINANEEGDIEKTIAYCKNEGYKLIYVFVNGNNAVMKAKATEIFGAAINEKVVLEKTNLLPGTKKGTVNKDYTVVNAAATITGADFCDTILELTIKAGAFSRFKLDEKLSDQYFLKMYRIWVDALINDKNYRIILAKSKEGSIIGFFSYKIIEEGYKIDFMSIDEGYKKMGIASALLQKMYEEIAKERLQYIVTEIHAPNTSVYNFFTSHGFTVKEVTEIYHVHL